MPALLAGFGVKRDQIVIRSLHIQPVPVNPDAAVADVRRATSLPEVMPDLTAVASIHGPRVVGRGHIEDAVDLQDRALDVGPAARCQFARAFTADDGLPAASSTRATRACGKSADPRERKGFHVRLVQLRK